MTGEARVTDHSQHYNEESFWSKIGQAAKKIGSELVEQALILFYLLKSPETPLVAKVTIVGALGYLFSPVDIIPDWIPGAGFTDDAAVIWAAIKAVDQHITAEIRPMASAKAAEIFG